MRYIDTLKEGDRVQETYFCKQKTTAMTKTGKEYQNVILQDKTGQLDAKIWDPGSMGIDEFDSFDYIEVTGDISVFNGQIQLSIKRARKVSENDINVADYMPTTEKDIEQMMAELLKLIATVENPYYKKLLSCLFVENQAFVQKYEHIEQEIERGRNGWARLH